jgi:hypothetical protein
LILRAQQQLYVQVEMMVLWLTIESNESFFTVQSKQQNQDNVLLASQYLRIQRMMLLLVNIHAPTPLKDFVEALSPTKGTKTIYVEQNDMMDQ